MKKISIVAVLFLAAFNTFASDDFLYEYITRPTQLAAKCIETEPYKLYGCNDAYSAVTSHVGLTTASVLLLKEAQEVKPDAINFAAGESATPALESVVEKIQIAVSEHGKEISFDEIIEALIGL